MVTASQMYPIRDIEQFTVAPVRASARRARGGDFPEIPRDEDSLTRFWEVAVNPTVLAAMELCSSRPGEWISIRDVEERAGRTPPEVKGDLAGLTMMVKRRFGRSNWPFDVEWGAGGQENAYYRMDSSIAAVWRSLAPPSEAKDTGYRET